MIEQKSEVIYSSTEDDVRLEFFPELNFFVFTLGLNYTSGGVVDLFTQTEKYLSDNDIDATRAGSYIEVPSINVPDLGALYFMFNKAENNGKLLMMYLSVARPPTHTLLSLFLTIFPNMTKKVQKVETFEGALNAHNIRLASLNSSESK